MMVLKGLVSVLTEWLLSRLAPMHLSESLTGDFVEEHGRGRSALWIWTQVFAAILIAAWQEIRTHTFVAMSGVVTGIASLWCLAALETMLFTNAGFPHAVHRQWPDGLLLLAIGFVYTAVSGWIVGRVHRTHRRAAVFSFLASVLIAPVLELPLLYWLAPSVFSATIVPLLPMALIATLIGAPVAILVGGFWDLRRG